TVGDAVAVMSDKGLGCVVVMNGNDRISGLITDGDIRRHIAPDLLMKSVDDIMTRGPKCVPSEMMVAQAVGEMNNIRGTFRRITVLPVATADGRLEGILHIHDC